MKKNLVEILSTSAFLGYVESMPAPQPVVLEGLFPNKTVPGLEYSYIKTAKGGVEMTAPSAFDAEAIAQHRDGFDAVKGDLPLFRRKMVLSEKQRMELLTLSAADQQGMLSKVVAHIFDDNMRLLDGTRATMKFLMSRALMNGAISFASKGGAVAIDYAVPAGNKKVLSGAGNVWSDVTAKILDNIKAWCDTVEDNTGVRPTRMLLNRTTFGHFASNTQIRNNLLPLSILASAGVAGSVIITDNQVSETIKAFTGLTEIIIYNEKVKLDGTTYDLVENNKIAIFPASAMGEFLVGTSPAEMSAMMGDGLEVSVDGNGVALYNTVAEKAPFVFETAVEFIGIPSMPHSDMLVIATVA